MTNLDKDFLQCFGGVESNSLINILQTDINENETNNQPQNICYFLYYDLNNDLISILTRNKKKNGF